MQPLIFTACLVILAISCGYARKYRSVRIVGGRDSLPDEFPYVVSIETIDADTGHGVISLRRCTGSLIAPAWVLTAAYCDDDPGYTRIRYGDMTLPQNTTTSYRKVFKFILHPSYHKQRYFSRAMKPMTKCDIALVYIEEISVKEYAKVSAVEYTGLIGLSVLYAGFGRTDHIFDDAKDQSAPLQVGEGGVVPCYGQPNLDPAICTVPRCTHRAQFTYYGDTGGPLIHDELVVGVCSAISLYYQTPEHEFRNEYTAVSPFLDWIRNVVKSEGP